ncbi:60S ribosomal protein L27-like [Hordeum vulgare subsp. vulgare]|uniref:60S ribosomal protein L27-like n=1 Tax=Hordeum vulgare subsp. vulgare TaxID=112509 RepID=UPI001D1A3F70|nr:60S ribosomal protein L27-like [Hordeum vulgare subsp. vulgare]
MVKFLKPGKAVILLQGRYAGKKAVIMLVFEEGTRDRPYGHCVVAGLAKYPKKVNRKDSAKKTTKKSRIKAFLKLVNYTHQMPTRYTLDVDLKEVVSDAPDSLTTKDKNLTTAKSAKANLEERFNTGKNRWFFTKLHVSPLESRPMRRAPTVGFSPDTVPLEQPRADTPRSILRAALKCTGQTQSHLNPRGSWAATRAVTCGDSALPTHPPAPPPSAAVPPPHPTADR